jgi:hypothetical protein
MQFFTCIKSTLQNIYLSGKCINSYRKKKIYSSWRKSQQNAITYQNFINPYLYEAQHVSGNTQPIIRSPKLHWQPLVFRTWKGVGRVVGGCWINKKYGLIKFWYVVASCWIFLHELYYDAWIHKHQEIYCFLNIHAFTIVIRFARLLNIPGLF